MQAAITQPGWVTLAYRAQRGLFVLLLALLSLPAKAADANALTGVDVNSVGDEGVNITMTFSQAPIEPQVITLSDPARLLLDFPDTKIDLKQRNRRVGLGSVEGINAAAAQGKARIVVDLSRPSPYTLRVEGQQLIVTVGQSVAPGEGAQASALLPGAKQSTKSLMAGQVENIDFRRGSDGEGRVLISLSDASIPTDVSGRGGNTVVSLSNAELPEALRQVYDVTDFGTPVRTVTAHQQGSTVEIVITTNDGHFEQMSYQSDRLLTVEYKKPADKRDPGDVAGYTGKPVTLNFQNVEVRSVLQILADVSDKNIVVSDKVAGTLALRLQNVPWDQAFDIVLQSRGLGTREIGDTIFVAPNDEIAAYQEQRKKVETLEPTRSEFIQVNYAKATELATMLKGSGSSLMSGQGQVSVDLRTNMLLVKDIPSKLAEIRALVARLDVPVSQVLIESRIVLATDTYARDLGARFGVTKFDDINNQALGVTSGSLVGTDVAVNGWIDTGINTIPDASAPRLNFNMPASPSAGNAASWALAILGPDYLIDLELSALQAEGKGEVVSSPRVMTANQKTATIRQGVEIPYQQASASGATTVSFKEAVLKLEVTPQITPDDRIVMDLLISRDSVGKVVPSGFAGGSIPSIDKREVQTQVLVNNGETVVLGGIYEQEVREQVYKVPLLGDIPVLGYLFRQTQKTNNKNELLIFVTPKIIKEGARVN